MHLRACFLSISINVLQYRLSISLTFGNDRYCPSFFSFRSAVFAALEIYSAISASNPGNQSMSRYNMRTLRGERVVKKKEGDRIKRWESDYERFVKDARNVLSVEKVRAEIAQTFEDNAIEHEKVSLICPLTKERIGVPARYRNCRHLQCFDLEGFFAMKSKKNFLNCPICNNIVNNAIDGLCIDKFFQNILSAVSGTTEINIFGDGTFRMTPSHSTLIIPKVIDDEGPYVPEHSTALACEVKSESGSDIEELGSVSSFDNDSESNECNAETQDLHISDTSMAGDTSQAVDPAENIYESKLESDSNVDNAEKLDSVSSFDIDSENNESDAEIQIMRVSDTSMATDTSQAAHSSNAKAPKSKIGEKRFKSPFAGLIAYMNSHKFLNAHTASRTEVIVRKITCALIAMRNLTSVTNVPSPVLNPVICNRTCAFTPMKNLTSVASVPLPVLKQSTWRNTSVLTLERSHISATNVPSPVLSQTNFMQFRYSIPQGAFSHQTCHNHGALHRQILNCDKWLSIDDPSEKTLRHKTGQHPQLEEALLMWIKDKKRTNIGSHVNWEITDFGYSNRQVSLLLVPNPTFPEPSRVT
ncbi:MIZ/SP-RING zinc finger domain-containing protein [Ditylenchus destructor]|uniref:MIZ/SP-RING zinc finger domain-containing protein n=1 Tax=Ditylenchus destructor TaxID=166010 RepID=A0AAD4MNN7_9BILA|nr:MIZ/SP-RING zinc finger domain-containing protein [Ditylenchus destructor]